VPTLTIRSLPEEVRRALRLRAAAHGRSVEAEVREILAAAVASRGVAEERRVFGGGSAIGLWKHAPYPEGRLMSEDFIAGRRLEAAREGEEITAEELAELSRRLDAFEIDLTWIEAYLEKRRRDAGR
jgi:plasmid stability protein